MRLGEKVQLLRKNNNMSQETLAVELNINRNCLSRIETGKSEPSISVVKGISKVFDVDIVSLLDMDDNNKSSKDKIKIINDGCHYLVDDDLDLLIRLISILRKEYVKKNNK